MEEILIRKIIKIDTEKCNGCGACAKACHEGAIQMINGKAVLTREDYCDGLGDCLPACPVNAISFEHREASAYDEKAVLAAKVLKESNSQSKSFVCPGTKNSILNHSFNKKNDAEKFENHISDSQLKQWPVQIKLAPVTADFFENANLLIAADCSAYAYANFHQDFMKHKITLIGCPKLDNINYAEKLTQIISLNNIKSVTVIRMEVPCCGGIEMAVKNALQASGKFIPWQIVTISTTGQILE